MSEPIKHSNKVFWEKQDGEATVEWLTDRRAKHGCVDYRYTLSGAHLGEPIEVWMLCADLEYDEDGPHPSWDKIVWADDGADLDDYLLDAYSDALSDDLRELLNQ